MLTLLLSPALLAAPPAVTDAKIEKMCQVPNYCEGAVFDHDGNCYVSHAPHITRVKPDGSHEIWATTGAPNGHKILADGTHLVCDGKQKAVLKLSADGKVIGKAASECNGEPLRRPNDIYLDAANGGFYFTDPGGSSENNPIGTVHYVDREGEVSLVAGGLAFPNGVVLRPGGKGLLVGESRRNHVLEFTVTAPGKVTGKRVFVKLPKMGPGQIANAPDGMCLDAAGNLYVAHFGMRRVQVIAPDGKLTRSHPGGNLKTSNVAFGGPDMDQLWVTGGLEKGRGPGGVFKLTLPGVTGLTILPARKDSQTLALDGDGKHVVFVSGDDEYRSEESMPRLAQILNKHHGFRCTVLFPIDRKDGTINPRQVDNIPGLEALKSADLMVMFLRFRDLPDGQMKHIVDYVNSGKPIVALRTSTHAFNIRKHLKYKSWSWRNSEWKGGFGRQVLGETWVNHYGRHKRESTRGVIPDAAKDSPLVNGVDDIWGPSDVYGLTTINGEHAPIVMGQVLKGMKPTDGPNPKKKLVPVAWTKSYTGEAGKAAKIFVTTMGHGGDFKSEGFRRLLANACFWAMDMKVPAKAKVDFVGPKYDPKPIGIGGHRRGLKPSHYRIQE